MNQACLPFGDPLALVRAPRARHQDPDTSKRAARRARVAQNEHCRTILSVLRLALRPLNAYEISASIVTLLDIGAGESPKALTQVQVSRRMRELLDVGLVCVDGERDGCSCYRMAMR